MIIVSQDKYTVIDSKGISLVFPDPFPDASIIDTESGKVLGDYPPDRARAIMQEMTNRFVAMLYEPERGIYYMPKE